MFVPKYKNNDSKVEHIPFDKKTNENIPKTIIDDYIGVMRLYYVSVRIISGQPAVFQQHACFKVPRTVGLNIIPITCTHY